MAGLLEHADGELEVPRVVVHHQNLRHRWSSLVLGPLRQRAAQLGEQLAAAQTRFPDDRAHGAVETRVILDLMMPEVSGFEVAHALRDSKQTARIPILVLTAKDLSAEDRARLNGAVNAILAKASFSTSELLAELRRALPRRAED